MFLTEIASSAVRGGSWTASAKNALINVHHFPVEVSFPRVLANGDVREMGHQTTGSALLPPRALRRLLVFHEGAVGNTPGSGRMGSYGVSVCNYFNFK